MADAKDSIAGLFKLGPVEREFPWPREIEWEVFRHNAPQALLRDLHRPVKKFYINTDMAEHYGVALDGGRALTASIKHEIYVRRAVPIQDLLTTNRDMQAAMAEARVMHREGWAEAVKPK